MSLPGPARVMVHLTEEPSARDVVRATDSPAGLPGVFCLADSGPPPRLRCAAFGACCRRPGSAGGPDAAPRRTARARRPRRGGGDDLGPSRSAAGDAASQIPRTSSGWPRSLSGRYTTSRAADTMAPSGSHGAGWRKPLGGNANGTVPPDTAFPTKTKASAARPVPGSPVTAWQAITKATNVNEPRKPTPTARGHG
jgi:hypothetical protein